ncbi:MAG: sulfatase-like hydrolase/transferase [Trueperaceae bacterium]|nr:sulfatase-like hydrolase/transferase [Trueperaceae bacterium]
MREGAKRPNVVVFFTDQQRWDTTGVHGHPGGLTPEFDAMAREGTHVARSFTVQPVCGPARACLQTGLHGTEHGSFTNGVHLDPDVPTLGDRFAEAGYDTAYVGKWHLASRDPVPEAERGGYATWRAANVLEFTSDAYATTVFDEDGRPRHLPGYRVDALADEAIRYLAEPREAPFFLFTSFLEPHHQNHRDDYPAPRGYAARYADAWRPPDLEALVGSAPRHLAGYYGMVKRLDEALGRVRDALRSLDLERDTVVLFTSDHGNHFKTRNDEYKRSCHEASIRVPTALVGPGFDGGGRIETLVGIPDLTATLLDVAGIAPPPGIRGTSLRDPALRARAGTDADELFVQISEDVVGRALRTRRWKYGVDAPDADPTGDPGAERYEERFLYDLEADPYELENLAGLDAFADVAADLRARLVAHVEAVEGRTPTIVPAASRPAVQRSPDLPTYP